MVPRLTLGMVRNKKLIRIYFVSFVRILVSRNLFSHLFEFLKWVVERKRLSLATDVLSGFPGFEVIEPHGAADDFPLFGYSDPFSETLFHDDKTRTATSIRYTPGDSRSQTMKAVIFGRLG